MFFFEDPVCVKLGFYLGLCFIVTSIAALIGNLIYDSPMDLFVRCLAGLVLGIWLTYNRYKKIMAR